MPPFSDTLEPNEWLISNPLQNWMTCWWGNSVIWFRWGGRVKSLKYTTGKTYIPGIVFDLETIPGNSSNEWIISKSQHKKQWGSNLETSTQKLGDINLYSTGSTSHCLPQRSILPVYSNHVNLWATSRQCVSKSSYMAIFSSVMSNLACHF